MHEKQSLKVKILKAEFNFFSIVGLIVSEISISLLLWRGLSIF